MDNRERQIVDLQRYLDVIDMYGELIYGCDMSHCIAENNEF